MELAESGTIRGLVRVPPDRSPSEVWIRFSGPAESFHTGVDPGGLFGVEDLSPGRWSLAVYASAYLDSPLEASVGSRTTWSHGPRDTMPSWYPHDAPRFVDLAPGETVSVEIDLSRHPACRLEGLLLLDGRALEPLREEVRLYLPRPAREALLELEGDPLFRARAPIGGDGRTRSAGCSSSRSSPPARASS